MADGKYLGEKELTGGAREEDDPGRPLTPSVAPNRCVERFAWVPVAQLSRIGPSPPASPVLGSTENDKPYPLAARDTLRHMY